MISTDIMRGAYLGKVIQIGPPSKTALMGVEAHRIGG
jgi:hypothetical protein